MQLHINKKISGQMRTHMSDFEREIVFKKNSFLLAIHVVFFFHKNKTKRSPKKMRR
jgi:hypothetical protein